MSAKQPSPQGISALLRKAGFARARDGLALRPEDAGFLILRHVRPAPGTVKVEHVSYRGAGHLAELNRYAEALKAAGYHCEISSTNSLIVSAPESTEGE